MNYPAYLAQVRERLQSHGFTEIGRPADMEGRLVLALERPEGWGRLLVVLTALGAGADQGAQESLVDASGAWVRNLQAGSGQACYMILVFPFEQKLAEERSAAIRSLQQESPERQWGVIPWTADLEVELVDRHTGFPQVGSELALALTEVPRTAVEEGWRRATGPRMNSRSPLLGNMGNVPTTRLILATTIAYYLWVLLVSGGVAFNLLGGPSGPALLQWGANQGGLVLVQGQHWRLITHILLHGGLWHLGFNMWALWNLGRHVEMIYGSARMAFIYLLAGMVGGLGSTVFRAGSVISVGASGAILGLMGALVYFALAIPGRRVDWRTLLAPVGINLMIGFFLPFIDNHAHIGGFLGGLLGGFLAGIPGQRPLWRTVAMAATGLLALLILVGLLPLPYLPI